MCLQRTNGRKMGKAWLNPDPIDGLPISLHTKSRRAREKFLRRYHVGICNGSSFKYTPSTYMK